MSENTEQHGEQSSEHADSEGVISDVDANDAEQPAQDQGQSHDDPLALAQAKAQEHWDKYVRTVAELDNVRKRAQRDVEKARSFGIERFTKELLGVVDSLEAASANKVAEASALLEGSEATLRLLHSTLEKFGVESIEPAGEVFDPQAHEAMTMVPAPHAEPGSIIDVIQKGYSLNGRLIRPARVVVAADTPAASDDA
ncbi:MAG: nucleotide exchange factor GrpE [Pseudomonadota bacterium]